MSDITESFPNSTSEGNSDVWLRTLIQEIFPNLDTNDRAIAEANLRAYFEVAFDIVARKQKSPTSLTREELLPTMKERSNVQLKI